MARKVFAWRSAPEDSDPARFDAALAAAAAAEAAARVVLGQLSVARRDFYLAQLEDGRALL